MSAAALRRPPMPRFDDDGYVAFVNALRVRSGLPALSGETMRDCWESFDVGGLVTPRPGSAPPPDRHPGLVGGRLGQ